MKIKLLWWKALFNSLWYSITLQKEPFRFKDCIIDSELAGLIMGWFIYLILIPIMLPITLTFGIIYFIIDIRFYYKHKDNELVKENLVKYKFAKIKEEKLK